MGCDIHAYLEYDEPNSSMGEELHKGTPFKYAEHFCRVSIHRNYYLFGLMAGVRDQSVEPISEPRGLPDRLSWNCLWDLILRVAEPKDENDDLSWVDDSREFCRREDADRYEATAAKYRKNAYYGYCDDTKTCVYHPDWHTHSWLSLFDLKQLVQRYSERTEIGVDFHDKKDPIPEGWVECEVTAGLNNVVWTMIETVEPQPLIVPNSIIAVVGAMEALLQAGCEPRLVFWFDN